MIKCRICGNQIYDLTNTISTKFRNRLMFAHKLCVCPLTESGRVVGKFIVIDGGKK